MEKKTTTRIAISHAPDCSRPRVSASLCSYPSFEPPGGGGCPGAFLVSMLMLELSFEARVVQWQQRHFGELPEIGGGPQCANYRQPKNIPRQRTQARAVLLVSRHHQPVHVHHAEEDHHGGDGGEPVHTPLHGALEQKEE